MTFTINDILLHAVGLIVLFSPIAVMAMGIKILTDGLKMLLPGLA